MFDGLFNPVRLKNRILFVAPSAGAWETWRSLLESKGLRAEAMESVQRASEYLAVLAWDAAVVDIEALPDPLESCLRLLKALEASPAAAPLIVVSGNTQLEAVSGLRHCGASDHLAKPFPPERLLERISVALAAADERVNGFSVGRSARRASVKRGMGRERVAACPCSSDALPPGLIIGRSPAIQRVIEQVQLVASKRTTVLITGETGTGKERVARAIHALSRRQGLPMISVNCGGIPANLLEDEFFGHVKGAFTDAHQQRIGRFEQAHGSNIFLDEIGDLPLELQPKLLRVLQEREIHRIGGSNTIRTDARVLAATNVDLWSRVAEGTFREDLFYRINVFPIHLPPLRERREDIPLFVDHFLERFCRRDGVERKYLDPAAETALMVRPWPGNIRELENAVEIAVIRSQDRICVAIEDFPAPRRTPQRETASAMLDSGLPFDFKRLVNEFERGLIHRVLEQTNGNKTQAAEVLHLKRTTLIEKLKKFDTASAPVHEI